MTVIRQYNSATSTWDPIVSGVQGPTAFRNKIINGDFGIWQRGTSFNTNGAYTADRWNMAFTGTGTALTITQQAFSPGNFISGYESQNYCQAAVTGGSGTSSLAVLQQPIEDVRMFAGQTVTVSFWAWAPSGTPSIGLDLYQSFGSGGSATVGGIGATKFALSSTPTRCTATISVPSISGKTVGSSSALYLRLWFSSGSDYNSLNNSLGIQSTTIQFWGVMIESGSTATSFTTASGSVGGELALCQRYYWRQGGASYETYGLVTFFSNGTNSYLMMRMPVTMRSAPTMNYSNLSHFVMFVNGLLPVPTAMTLWTTGSNSPNSYMMGVNVSSGGSSGYSGWLCNNSTTSGWIDFSAEL